MANVGQPCRARWSSERRARRALLDSYELHNEEHHDALIQEFPGVGALARLRAAGVRVAVVTSKRRFSVEMALKTFPASVVVDRWVTMEDTEEHKPRPEPLLKGWSSSAPFPSEGGLRRRLPFDVAAARAAGVKSVAVSWGAFTEKPCEPRSRITSYPISTRRWTSFSRWPTVSVYSLPTALVRFSISASLLKRCVLARTYERAPGMYRRTNLSSSRRSTTSFDASPSTSKLTRPDCAGRGVRRVMRGISDSSMSNSARSSPLEADLSPFIDRLRRGGEPGAEAGLPVEASKRLASFLSS